MMKPSSEGLLDERSVNKLSYLVHGQNDMKAISRTNTQWAGLSESVQGDLVSHENYREYFNHIRKIRKIAQESTPSSAVQLSKKDDC